MRSLFAAAAAIAASAATVGQVHIMFTGNIDEMAVSWAVPETGGACTDATQSVSWGTSSGNYPNHATATGYYYTGASICAYDTVMTGLSPATTYYYQVGSKSYSFTNRPARADGSQVYAIFADFGYVNDVAITQLIAESGSGQYDTIIHAGDFAYNFEDNSGQNGNDFMNTVEPIAATHPYMGVPGNHESDSDTFAQYRTRFYNLNNAGRSSGSNSSLYYSFDDGLVHWVGIDTEMWSYGGTPAEIKAQLDWLAADLAAVDRTKTPWVIGFGHKQGWMDKQAFNTSIEPLLQSAGVDFYICGHQHNMQRLLPQNNGVVEKDCVNADASAYINCKSMTSVVVGSPGCKELLSPGQAPTGVQVFAQAYGYAHLTVFNATHLYYQWEELGQRDASGRLVRRIGTDAGFYDEFWLINTNH